MKPKTGKKTKTRKLYEKPALTKLTPEQAKLKLTSGANRDDLKKMFPPDSKKSA
jgi:hypothetical protein